ncbi:MAG: SH3 domain-containing protein [Eubacteriaceae bacterium]|nr:SH3 domain-containing protein [Eubacteriaceae bacterium]
MRKIAIALSLALVLACLPANAVSAKPSNYSFAGYATNLGGDVLNVRKGPSTSNQVIFRITDCRVVAVISKTGDWLYVEYLPDQYGYIHSDYISSIPSTTGVVDVDTRVNFRMGPSTSNAVIALLNNGDPLRIFGMTGDWFMCLANGCQIGFIHKDYVSCSVPSANFLKVNVDTSLAVRPRPTTSATSFALLKNGTTVISTGSSGAWRHIIHPSSEAYYGWSHSDYLK